MALFSDIDWIVVAAVGAFLLFGPRGREFVRQMGRLYGRAMGFKAEMMKEISASSGLPPRGTHPIDSLRASLLGPVETVAAPGLRTIPDSVPSLGVVTLIAPIQIRAVETLAYGAAVGPGVWSVALTNQHPEGVRLR
jgi:hypothetical protein